MQTEQSHTIGAVANVLPVPRWWLAYLVERGEVPGPSLQVPGRRLFTGEDVRKVREALARRPRQRAGRRAHTRTS